MFSFRSIILLQPYRRRDLRNNLASRLGMEDKAGQKWLAEHKTPELPKKRVRFNSIPLDVSDFTIEDMLKEFGTPVYIKFYEMKDARSCIVEFEDLSIMEKIIKNFNGKDLNGTKLEVEMYEQYPKKSPRNKPSRPDSRDDYSQYRRNNSRGSRGSHYSLESKSSRPASSQKKTAEDLDAELDAYMNS
ncbi:Yra2p NDAI_0G00140 [Naumovozyma dairenensis CBS 421]|uniref:RRM domain-containing protein n=1 Tax=Naumovozyma dairenensis (strain ATCC 10597 / BCRC 20456 / CBS 421 / NBRC 0211 / NRRL Y-12639) TaxID=1071378 RepID=G0WDC9_NAUDC|nr:hypothetical protein NDAI_0G00140 [Naumovozyma dairenensis CBS 421]CCD25790.2 hypothetical protein NDAI_0G00140 [Naumovozyma dairenensis CBS 421]